MIKVVLDTNILISSVFWKGAPRQVVDLALHHQIQNFTSIKILEELQSVLADDFDVPATRLQDILRETLSYSALIKIEKIKIEVLRDKKDLHVVACAVKAGADYIVTGDKDLLTLGSYRGIKIVSASIFLSHFNQ